MRLFTPAKKVSFKLCFQYLSTPHPHPVVYLSKIPLLSIFIKLFSISIDKSYTQDKILKINIFSNMFYQQKFKERKKCIADLLFKRMRFFILEGRIRMMFSSGSDSTRSENRIYWISSTPKIPSICSTVVDLG